MSADAEAPAPPRRRHPVRWVAAAGLVVLVVLAVVLATRPPYQATAVDGPLVGAPAPAFSGTSLLTGAPVRLSQYRGHWLLLNFFASWCSPCQEEEPNLVQFAAQQARTPGGARLVSVVFQDADAAAAAFDRSQGAGGWPTLSDPGGQIADAYGVSAPPTTFLVSPAGRVVGEYVAPVTVSQLDQLLAQARHRAAGA